MRLGYLASLLLAGSVGAPAAAADIQHYRGMCDASAAVMVDETRFVVANDEDNILRVYRIGAPDPLQTFDMAAFLGTGADEADIEGAAMVGTRIYWITSHGANKNGKPRPARRRFFATEVSVTPAAVTLVSAGTPYTALVADLDKLASLKPYKIAKSAEKAPEEGGLNIEGLAVRPGGGLFLALRSPVVDGKAALVPILNPAEMVDLRKAAKLDPAVRLGLGGLGVRSIDLAKDGRSFVIAAGPVGSGPFALKRWPGSAAAQPTALAGDFGVLAPEAIAAEPGAANRLLLLSDDGDELVDGKACKDAPADKRSFRGVEIVLGG